MEDVKWLLKKVWTPNFDIVVCCYSRGDLLGKTAYRGTKSGGRSMGATCRNGNK